MLMSMCIHSCYVCECASCSSCILPTPPVFGHWCLFLFCTFLTCGTTHHCQVLLWAGSNVEITGLFLWVALSVLHVGYVCSVAYTSKKHLFLPMLQFYVNFLYTMILYSSSTVWSSAWCNCYYSFIYSILESRCIFDWLCGAMGQWVIAQCST